jgi:hypothetical protein
MQHLKKNEIFLFTGFFLLVVAGTVCSTNLEKVRNPILHGLSLFQTIRINVLELYFRFSFTRGEIEMMEI